LALRRCASESCVTSSLTGAGEYIRALGRGSASGCDGRVRVWTWRLDVKRPGAIAALGTLAGVMEDKNAAKGVLVTTSWVGKASRDFAARSDSRIEIIEGRQLKVLLKEHLGLDVLIGLPRLPPSWEQRDVS